MFLIEDQVHAEEQGLFSTLTEVITELKLRASIPWNEPPNVAPCMSWRTCGRLYDVVEFDTTSLPWIELKRFDALKINASGVWWLASVIDQDGPLG